MKFLSIHYLFISLSCLVLTQYYYCVEGAFLPPNYVFVRDGPKVADETLTEFFLGVVDMTADGKTLIMAADAGVYINTRLSVNDDFQLGTKVDFSSSGFVRKIDASDNGVVAVAVRNESYLMFDIVKEDKTVSQVWETEIPCELWHQPSLAISGDGKTVVYGFGCQYPNPPSPSVFVYVFQLVDDGVTWTATELDLSEANAEDNKDGRRFDVKISGDGSTVFVGLSWMDTGAGGVFVFTRDENDGSYSQTAKLVPNNPKNVGDKMATNQDGTILIAVSQSVNSRQGGFWVFQRENVQSDTWELAGFYNLPSKDTEPTSPSEFGPIILAMGIDDTIAVGRFSFKSYQGAVWIFRRVENSSTWELLDERLEPDTAHTFQFFGFSMGFSHEGSLVVGTSGSETGGAFLFRAVEATSGPSTSPVTISPTAPTMPTSAASTNDQSILVLSAALAGSIGGLVFLGLATAALLYLRKRRRYLAVAFNTPTTHVFLTHEWGEDAAHKNHQRVAVINEELKKLKLSTWFDSDRLSGDVLNQIVAGIDKTGYVVIFLTKRYMEKVAKVSTSDVDYCQMEFQYALRRRGRDRLIVVVMEPELLDTKTWSGPIGALLGNAIYIDFTKDENAAKVASEVYEEISRRQQWTATALDKPNVADRTQNANKEEQVV